MADLRSSCWLSPAPPPSASLARRSRLDSRATLDGIHPGEASSVGPDRRRRSGADTEVDDVSDVPMFRIAPSAVSVHCSYDWRFGWSARVAVPTDDGGSWIAEVYGPCSASELVDAVGAALQAALEPLEPQR